MKYRVRIPINAKLHSDKLSSRESTRKSAGAAISKCWEWPCVEVGFSFENDNIGFHVSNTGIGPARIQAANVTYKGTKVESWIALVDSMNLDRNVEEKVSGISDKVNLEPGSPRKVESCEDVENSTI